MAFLDLNGLSYFKQKIQTWVSGIVGETPMGTTATTLTGAIAEHSTEISALENVDPVLSVNNATPDEHGNVSVTTVDNAVNLVSNDTQSSEGTFVQRSSGGDASISSGNAWLNIVRGNNVLTGYVPRNLVMTIEAVPTIPRPDAITATCDRNTFISVVTESSYLEFNYGAAWNVNPALYGITVSGTPESGDSITVDYEKENVNFLVDAAVRPIPVGITADINNASFIAYVEEPGTYEFNYTTLWDHDPSAYGITVSGTPENGDNITVIWDGENDPDMSVSSEREPDDPITATYDYQTLSGYMVSSGLVTLTYTSSWSEDPALYGITIIGTPINGDRIIIDYTKESITLEVIPAESTPRLNPITAIIDEDIYDNQIQSSGTKTFTYTNSWSENLQNYGITVTNTPVWGDKITISCSKEVRGTIQVFNPETFYSTNWNLYNRTLGYARVVKYSDTYGFIIGGTLTKAYFSTSNDPSAEKTELTLTSIGTKKYSFNIEEDGFVWVTSSNDADVYILMTWSDWTSGPPDGYAAHSASIIDLSSIMSNFSYGLMKAGAVTDEINFSMKTATSKIERLSWSIANLETVKSSGRSYEYDTNYIYAEKAAYTTYSFDVNNQYTAHDHGIEVFTGTTVPGYALTLYGQNLKDKLRTDVITISSQSLTSAQKKNARKNIGAVGSVNSITPDSNGNVVLPTDTTVTSNSTKYITSGAVYNKINAVDAKIKDMVGCTDSTAGTAGLVPAISAGRQGRVLTGEGLWRTDDAVYRGSITSEMNINEMKTSAHIGGWKISSGVAATKTELPEQVAGSLYVQFSYSSSYYRQVFYKDKVSSYYYMRHSTGTAATAWSSWEKYTAQSSDDARYVAISGAQEITGGKTFKSSLNAKNSAISPITGFYSNAIEERLGAIQYYKCGDAEGHYLPGRFRFSEYSPKSDQTGLTGFYEAYTLPAVTKDLTEAKTYNILTTKSAVTVAQGGTGATTVAAARTNLGVPADSDVVHLTGDETVGGNKILIGEHILANSSTNPNLYFRGYKNDSNCCALRIIDTGDGTTNNYGNSYLQIYEYSPAADGKSTTGFAERYRLPSVATGLSASVTYNILTSKNAVTIAQGGTGATTAAAALTALGAAADNNVVHLSGTETITGNKTFGGANVISGTSTFNGAVAINNGAAHPALTFRATGNASNSGRLRMAYAGTSSSDNTYPNAYFDFIEYSPATDGKSMLSTYESFTLPSADVNRGSSEVFSILTSKTPVTVAQGGTGGTGTESVSNVVTASTGWTVTSSGFASWGKVASLTVSASRSTALTTGTSVIGTVPSDKEPRYTMAGGATNGMVAMISSSGSITAYAPIEANTTYTFRFTYILP